MKNKLIFTSYGLTTKEGQKLIGKELGSYELEDKKIFLFHEPHYLSLIHIYVGKKSQIRYQIWCKKPLKIKWEERLHRAASLTENKIIEVQN